MCELFGLKRDILTMHTDSVETITIWTMFLLCHTTMSRRSEIAQLDIDSIELPSSKTGQFIANEADPALNDVLLSPEEDGIPALLILHFKKRKGDQSRLGNRGKRISQSGF